MRIPILESAAVSGGIRRRRGAGAAIRPDGFSRRLACARQPRGSGRRAAAGVPAARSNPRRATWSPGRRTSRPSAHAARHRSPAAAATLAVVGAAVEGGRARRLARRGRRARRSQLASCARRWRGSIRATPSCFVMRHLHGLAPAAIGAALGISENHVSVSVHRARKALEAIACQGAIPMNTLDRTLELFGVARAGARRW